MNIDPDLIIHTYPGKPDDLVDVYSCQATIQKEIDSFFNYFQSTFKPKHLLTEEYFKKNLTSRISTEGWVINPSVAFVINYRSRAKLWHEQSTHHLIDVIENGIFGKMLFLNGVLQIAEKYDEIYFDTITEPLSKSTSNGLSSVAILGGGSGGTLRRLLKLEPKKVCVVDVDFAVIDVAKKHLQNINHAAFDAKNVEVVINDANVFLKDANGKFDGIIYDLSDYTFLITDTDKQVFLDATLANIKDGLKNRGVVSLHCCSEFDTKTLDIFKPLLLKYFSNVSFKKVFIPSFCENWIFASAEKIV